MSRSASAKTGLRRVASVAAFAVYVGVAASLYQNEIRMNAAGQTLARRNHAIESDLLGVRNSLDHLERAGHTSVSLTSRLREREQRMIVERRERTHDYETWKAQSGAWRIKRWVVLTIATLAFLPVVVWGFQSWGIWLRDKRLNRTPEE